MTILSLRPRRVAQNQICYLYRYIDIADKDHRDNLVSAALVSDRGEVGTTLALVITSSGQILNIFSFTALSLSRVLFLSGLSVCLLAAFWSLLCFICALCALCDAPHIHNNDRKDVALHVDHHYGRNLSHAKPIAWSDVFYGLLVPVWHTQIWRSNGTGNAKIAKVWTKHRQHSLRFGNRKIFSRFGQNEIMRDKESCEDQFG